MRRFRQSCRWLATGICLFAGTTFQAGGCALRERLDDRTLRVQEIIDDMLRTAFWGPIVSLRGDGE